MENQIAATYYHLYPILLQTPLPCPTDTRETPLKSKSLLDIMHPKLIDLMHGLKMTVVVPEMRLLDDEGQRLYLSADERIDCLEAFKYESREIRMLCHLYHFTSARSSEALKISPERIKIDDEAIILQTLKKRKFDGKGRLKKPQFRHKGAP